MHSSTERGMRTMNWVQVFVHKRNISAVKVVEFVSAGMSRIILIGHWSHTIILDVHATTEEKTDDIKCSFYKELELVVLIL
jgi:hypothetical protein